ncbi:MAG: RNA methyltransferase, partial [Chitinophagales bacterium]
MNLQLPPALISSLEGLPGFDKESFQAIHAQVNEFTSIRLNPQKNRFTDYSGAAKPNSPYFSLSQESLYAHVPWSSQGYYLKERPLFTSDPLFHAGAYYVQEASS